MFDGFALTATSRRAFDRQAADLKRVLGDRFVALIASTPHAGVAFAVSVQAGDLDACGSLAAAWHHDGLETPLLLTPEEFRRSLDAFPVEYQALIDRHVIIAGTPPFGGIAVPDTDLRRACEVQAKSHLIHLRQGWIDAAGHADRLAALIVRSAPPLRALLSQVARLGGQHGQDAPSATAGAAAAGLPADLVARLLALETAPHDAPALVPQLPAYLAAAERLWTYVDQWQTR
jgi:hypothetical protein